MARALTRELVAALSLGVLLLPVGATGAAAQSDRRPESDWLSSAPGQADEALREGFEFRLERLKAERDALVRGNPTYVVADHARPCLVLRAAPDGEEVDCLEPGTDLTLLGLEGNWSRVSQGGGVGAWVKSEYIEPAPAASGSRARMAADLAAARQANSDLRERLDAAETSLQSAWDAQITLSARLLEAQASKEGANDGHRALADSVERLTAERDDLTQAAEALEQQRRQLEENLAQASERHETASRRLAQTSEALARAELTFVVGSRASPCLKVRPAPGSEQRLDCLSSGTRLLLLELDDSWARVRLPEGVEAWVNRQFLEPYAVAEARANAATRRVVELQAEVDSRRQKAFESERQAGELSERMAQLTDELAATVERAATLEADIAAGRDREARLRSQLEDTKRALTLGGSTWVVTSGADPCLNLRVAPGSGAPIDCLKPGTRLTLLELQPEWGRSRLEDGSEGWTSLEFIEPAPTTPAELEALETARAELAASRATASSLESELLEATAEGDRLRTEAGSRQAAIEQLQAQLDSQGRELEASRDANRELEQTLEQADVSDDILQARVAVDDLERGLRESERERERLAAASGITELPDQLARARATIADLEWRLRDSEETRDRVESPDLVAEAVAPEPSPASAEPVATQPAPDASVFEAALESHSTVEPELDAADPVELARRVDEWARAWSEQRVEDYLGFYASTFEPANGASRADWADQRRRRLRSPIFVEVKLSELEARTGDPVSVRFVQAYRSNTFSDTVRKVLTFVREGGAWKIATEVSDPPG